MSFTSPDMIDHLVDFVGGGPADAVQRDARRAALQSYRELANATTWPYFYRHGRIITNAPYNGTTSGAQATITYDHTGGAYERQVTLTGDVWPAWVAGGYIRLADFRGISDVIAYRVAEKISSTVLTLDPEVNPGVDIASGTTFVLYQDTYILPADYIAQDEALYAQNFGGMSWRHPREWLFENRYIGSNGVPRYFTITGDPQYPGRLVMRVFPWPDAARSIDFIYQRRPRPLLLQQASGIANTTASSATLTATSGLFTPAMVGSTVRVSATRTPPTSIVGSMAGLNPPAIESTIAAYVSPTVVNLEDPASASLSAVAFTVSDPIDIEPGSMLNAYMRCSEKEIATARSLKNQAAVLEQWRYALEQAKCAASTSFGRRVAGPSYRYIPRLRDYPLGADQP